MKKRVPRYYKIYEQIYENPTISLLKITENTRISRSTVSRYLIEMRNLSIIQVPSIFLKPAQNYHEYACFLRFENPLSTYSHFRGFPNVISRWLCSGKWNLLLICDKLMNLSVLKGFKESVFQSVKGVTHLSKVVHIDWDTAVQNMYRSISPPTEKTTLYKEVPSIPWNEEGWTLYKKFRHDIRLGKRAILDESRIQRRQYLKWFSGLPQFTSMTPAFYPHGLDQYLMVDFLFKSEYQKQLTDILGMLPSTSTFFSAGEYLLARLCFLNKKEKDDLFSLIFTLEERGFFTNFYQAMVISPSDKGR